MAPRAIKIEAGETAAAIRQWAALRHLPATYLQRWLALAEQDRIALLELTERLRPRTGQFVTAFELCEEIAVRERVAIASIVVRAEIRQILDGNGSAPARARELLETLRAIRFPRLRRAADRLANEIARLQLPPGVKVVLPATLASDEVKVEISAHGAAELERLVDAVAKARAGLSRIAELMGGTESIDDEV